MLYQNDDSGKDYTGGFLAGLGKENESLVTAKASYEVTDPTVDSQIIQIKNSGATVFFNDAAPRPRRRQSARSPTSAGSRRTSSPTFRPRSRRC